MAQERRPTGRPPSTAGCGASGRRTCSTSTSSSTACRCTARLSLGETDLEHAYDRGHAARDFQNLLIETARQRGSAFTLFGNFRTDEKGRIDLKRYGLMPLFTAARVLSIRHDVRARSTVERLQGVAAKGIAPPQTIEAILDAHRLMLGTVIGQQLADTEAGVPLSPRVDLGRLDKAEKAKLKDALAQVDEAIGLVSEGRL